jgi:hypothetical protein
MHKPAQLLSAPDAEATSPGAPRHWWSEPLRPDEALWRQGIADLRWSFARPWHWFSGVAVNLVLSVLFLVVVPLSRGHHQDWAVVVGSYFAVFILADVTTTNVLGADARRVAASLAGGVPTFRLLLIKNLTLLIIVGLPTMIATAVITVTSEADYRLAITLSAVLFPILTWLGVGNLVSVALPVSPQPLRRRWAERRQLGGTVRWLAHLALPYLLYLLVSPVGHLPTLLRRLLRMLPQATPPRGWLLAGSGIGLWVLGTVLAVTLARWRPVAFDDLPP